MAKRKGLREIEFGICGGEFGNHTCIYDNGVIDPAEFLHRVREFHASDVPQDAREALELRDVEHVRFRPMSPSEAKSWGCDYGVMQADGQRGYPVTRVVL